MIRDKSARKPAKGAPKEDAAKQAEPAKAAKAPAGKKGVIAIAPPSFRRERALIKRGVWPVAGCDEAGRGPLAGPVVAAAVILDPDRIPRGIDDSKRLTAEERERLFDKICATAQVSVAVASRARIDRDNILRASLWALKRAVVALPQPPQHVFVDGRDRLDTACDCEAVIGGDGIVLSIAAASIVAKVTRDRLMCALAQDCPGYGFEQHKGYAVPEHLDALDRLGPTVHHRSFFAPVAAARAKHMPWTVEPVQDLFEVAEVEVQVVADTSATL
ncbi:ribonuclease HII [Bradyrhizobium sp. CCBAU 45389]|uniref:ribonuclease HII n=1 Tax=Bradyrhizobium sp. CCBAU 45389 TaxID=858429 RepID=UPI0023066F9B|nr:ribonuclease HII [Bradyrhizobium sp. CCBAU 45389]MDA9398688.1 ribonuclease HII [Bradyrhizobium sp. CCBAU 45389]